MLENMPMTGYFIILIGIFTGAMTDASYPGNARRHRCKTSAAPQQETKKTKYIHLSSGE